MKKRRVLFICFLCLLPWAAYANEQRAAAENNYQTAVEYLKQDQFDLAIEHFQKALQEEKPPAEQAKIYNLIGLAYLKQGVSVASAIGSFEQAMKLDPKNAESYFNLASAYAGDDHDPGKAAFYFQKTIEVDPNYSKAYFGLGWFSLTQKDDPEQALKYFEKTIETYKDFAEAYYGIGLAYIRLRKPHMALGAVSMLREIPRDDLAAVLEKSITELSPPGEDTAIAAAPAAATTQKPAPAPGGGKSPFEVIMKGKVIPPKKAS